MLFCLALQTVLRALLYLYRVAVAGMHLSYQLHFANVNFHEHRKLWMGVLI